MSLNGREGRLGLLPSEGKDDVRGGSSIPGDTASRGEVEKAELLSEIRDGAPSTDSALDASETAGEGSGPSKCCRNWLDDVIVRGFGTTGLVKDEV